MADDGADAPQQPPQDAQTEPQRGKRRAPTIDLTATEVPEQNAAAEAAAPDNEQPPSESSASGRPPGGPPNARMVRLGIAAAGGAGLVVLLLLGLWLSGLFPIGYANDNALKQRVASLQKQVSELQSRPQVPNENAVQTLSQRVGKIEATLAKLPPADTSVADKLTAADNAMKALGLALTALSQRTSDAAGNAADARKAADAAMKAVSDLRASMQTAAAANSASVPRADMEALEKRVAALETQTKAAREAINTNSGNDNAARLAMSAAVLRDAVAVGAPYAAELAAVKALGGNDKALQPLEPFAKDGAPTAQTLAHELAALTPQMLKIAGTPPPSADFLAKLEANAARLVRVRPVNAPQGKDAATVLARLEVDCANDDIAAALADLAELPDNVRAPAEAWIAKAKARQAAVAAARQYAAATARALAPP